jgi:hypothetical protein
MRLNQERIAFCRPCFHAKAQALATCRRFAAAQQQLDSVPTKGRIVRR